MSSRRARSILCWPEVFPQRPPLLPVFLIFDRSDDVEFDVAFDTSREALKKEVQILFYERVWRQRQNELHLAVSRVSPRDQDPAGCFLAADPVRKDLDVAADRRSDLFSIRFERRSPITLR
jgi:hypothetical protein